MEWKQTFRLWYPLIGGHVNSVCTCVRFIIIIIIEAIASSLFIFFAIVFFYSIRECRIFVFFFCFLFYFELHQLFCRMIFFCVPWNLICIISIIYSWDRMTCKCVWTDVYECRVCMFIRIVRVSVRHMCISYNSQLSLTTWVTHKHNVFILLLFFVSLFCLFELRIIVCWLDRNNRSMYRAPIRRFFFLLFYDDSSRTTQCLNDKQTNTIFTFQGYSIVCCCCCCFSGRFKWRRCDTTIRMRTYVICTAWCWSRTKKKRTEFGICTHLLITIEK